MAELNSNGTGNYSGATSLRLKTGLAEMLKAASSWT